MRQSALVAVLDWGLGHATRCVSIIRELQKQNVKVVVGASGLSLELLKEEFPHLQYYELPSYRITYPKRALLFSMLLQLPQILRAIGREHSMTEKIIHQEKIDFIISDNRYGCYSKKIISVFVCHQLNLQLPKGFAFLSSMTNSIHRNWIKQFNQVWVPDEEIGFRFSGWLSQSNNRKVKRVGILSRFSGKPLTSPDPVEIVAVVSGPEPQRTIFENLLRDQLLRSNKKSLLVKGKPGHQGRIINNNLTEIEHLNSRELESVLSSADFVVTRSGYSSIMDLAVLGKKVLLVPTPSQTEQEYLADYLTSNNLAMTQKQEEFNLVSALNQIQNIKPFPRTTPNRDLPQAITELICG